MSERYDDPVDDTLSPSEATDSDELRNDDGDVTVTAPDQWLPADDSEQTLDDTDSSWGEQPEHERRRRWLQEQRPPHWE